jgi:hypothetical protein
LTNLPFNLILKGLKFEIEKIRGLYAKFENCKDQIEKWSISVQNYTVSAMHSFFFFFLWRCKPTCKEEQKCEMQCPCLAKTQRLIPIVMKIDAPGR